MIASSTGITNASLSNGTAVQATQANSTNKKRKNAGDSSGNTSTASAERESGTSTSAGLTAPKTSAPTFNVNNGSSVTVQLQQQHQHQDSAMFWQWSIERIDAWMRSTAAVFDQQQEKPTTIDANASLEELNLWVSNMVQALKSACNSYSHQQQENQGIVDEFHILDATFSRGENVIFTPGSVVSRLNVGGWINGLSGIKGGLVDPAITSLTTTITTTSKNKQQPVPKRLEKLAHALHRATCAKLEIDMLESTPLRIVELLCPEVSMQEISNIRRRIFDTVVLGKGMQQQQQQQNKAAEEEEDLPVAASKPSSEVEKWHRCKTCNNNDQSKFASDTKNGDIICTECGTVASENLMHEGSQFRKFEGEVDRNHHGDAPNYLYSNAHNLSTTLGAGIGQATSFQQSTTSSSNGMFSMSGGNKKLENILRNAHAYTEMNISQFGKDERKTRIGYKDRQKKDAFSKMTHVGDALNLHDAVVQRSKELFAGFRDDRELVQQFKGVVAACLCEAFDQLSRDGRNILKVRAGDSGNVNNNAEEWNVTRALWRNAMHNTTAASKGTSLFSSSSSTNTNNLATASSGMTTDEEKTSSPGASTTAVTNDETNDFEKKPAATWDMDDVRAWLLQASRSIARQWANAARNTTATTSNDGANVSIPSGSLDELEGKLVKYTFLLCDELEKEDKSGTNADGPLNKQRVHTPRVNDIEKLGIKWQSIHERGSGVATNTASTATRTAGQRLILKTTKKLSSIIQDALAGEAFHKELRHLLARQEERNKQDRMSENAHKRFQQMQRKPWIKRRLE
jgi:hypothetical protein